MPETPTPFAQTLLPFVASTLAPHRNPVTCLLCGVDGPLMVTEHGQQLEGDIVLVRPNVEHSVKIDGHAKVLYFDGLEFPFDTPVAHLVPTHLSALAIDALDGSEESSWEFRLNLAHGRDACPAAIAAVVKAMVADPMRRMPQQELVARTGMERTRALRLFKNATGMTFRAFKNWVGLQSAAKNIAQGVLIRTAALDAGFADSAHFTNSFRTAFGTTPSLARVKESV